MIEIESLISPMYMCMCVYKKKLMIFMKFLFCVIKQCSEEIIKPLQILINSYFSKDKFPSNFEYAKVVPIYLKRILIITDLILYYQYSVKTISNTVT